MRAFFLLVVAFFAVASTSKAHAAPQDEEGSNNNMPGRDLTLFATGRPHNHVRRRAQAATPPTTPAVPPSPPVSSAVPSTSWAGVVYAYYFQRPSRLPAPKAINLLQGQGT